MDNIPQIISTKDMSYLSDMFEWNYNAFKQVSHYIGEVQDDNIKELLERFRNMHEDHLNYIISILKKEEYEEECDCEECSCEDCQGYLGEEEEDNEE